ncbi:hypothetical protein [Propylenella binzhouense]|uniref:Plasmid segregation centromere-binding protein ParG n=1 Tax=Propylenella binzhouense TaxID=2555902 RepID=A0A964T838_9HYPH|nr:hypothetical protein [Propylenella binzhouense]
MSRRDAKRSFASRPTSPEAWVRAPGKPATAVEAYTARLTIDVTPALRGRIKVTAFRRGQTVADMLRALLEREFPDDTGSVR